MLNRALAVWQVIYDRAGDPRTKNMFLLILSAMSMFGIVAPKTATTLRDTVLSLL